MMDRSAANVSSMPSPPVPTSPDLVFELIGRHGIECWAMRSG
jgi:hypothetical protein